LAVVGDQVLTDGLLAWRCRQEGAAFLHWETTLAAPWLPRAQRMIGRLLLPYFFRTVRS
jgi:hypothetical protein